MNLKHLLALIGAGGALLCLAACGGGGGGGGACGVDKAFVKIAGGEQCVEGSPNVVFLDAVDSKGNELWSCTGAYVSLTKVLTAAHCLERWSSGDGMWVISKGYKRWARRFWIHRLYDGSVQSPFDLAIIEVNEPINSGPLPVLMSRSPVEGEDAVAYGYGLDAEGDIVARIERGDAPLVATYTKFAGYYAGTSAILSTGAGSTCSGDSGGPVLAKNDAGDWGIIGVTRAGPEGCSAEEGRPSLLSSTESNGAVSFITALVPDLATN